MFKVEFDEKRCKACGLCAAACPRGIIEIDYNKVEVNGMGCAKIKADGCIGCGCCATVCPDIAVRITAEDKKEVNI